MTIAEFSRDAVRKYLRSVVLVDDNAFNAPRSTIAGEMSVVEGIPDLSTNGGDASSDGSPGLAGADEDAQSEGTLQRSDGNRVDACAVTEGFAREGIVCGVYKPHSFPQVGFENDQNFMTLLGVCKNADVFILDWHLFSENEKAVALLLGKMSHDDCCEDSPRPVRFCAIYTAARVDGVLGDVFRAMNQDGVTARIDAEARKVHAGGMTVCVYAKEEATSEGAISAEDLACRIIEDFAKTYEGILPSLALRGIASIRDNAKRILDKFPAGMDPAFVLHAGLTISGKSIADDVVNLLGDEVAAVLADTQVTCDSIYELCREYVEGECDETVLANLTANTALVPSDVTWQDIKDFFLRIFSDPAFPSSTKVFRACKKHKRDLLDALSDLVRRKAASDPSYRFGALSALFCHRTNYSAAKTLRFGTVVKCMEPEELAGRFYLCLMPSCDSIRLKDRDGNGDAVSHRFPFWHLTKVSSDHQGRNHGLVLEGLNGEFEPYCAKGKIRESFSLFEFNSQNTIVPFNDTGVVKTVGGEYSFEWVAELKSAHIQRMAEFVSREFSRVGLTESEWLRLQVDR